MPYKRIFKWLFFIRSFNTDCNLKCKSHYFDSSFDNADNLVESCAFWPSATYCYIFALTIITAGCKPSTLGVLLYALLLFCRVSWLFQRWKPFSEILRKLSEKLTTKNLWKILPKKEFIHKVFVNISEYTHYLQ